MRLKVSAYTNTAVCVCVYIICVKLTTCSTDAPLLIMIASPKSGRSEGKQSHISHPTGILSHSVCVCVCVCVRTSPLLGKNADEGQVVPQRLQKVVQV